jgi:hypothetical protein
MCVVATNAVALYVRFGCGSGGAGVLVAEGDVVVYEVADGLHARPAERRMSEEPPSLIGKAIGLAVAAAKQEQQGFCRQVLDLVLQGRLGKVEAEFAPDMDSVSWDQRRFDATGKVTAGWTPTHNHRQGFFVDAMVNFIQILFATEYMLDSTEGSAQSGRAPNLAT